MAIVGNIGSQLFLSSNLCLDKFPSCPMILSKYKSISMYYMSYASGVARMMGSNDNLWRMAMDTRYHGEQRTS